MTILRISLIISGLIVLSTISTGIYYIYKGTKPGEHKLRKLLKINLTGFIPTMAMALIMFAPTAVQAAEGDASSAGMGYLGAALATGLACIGSGYGVGVVGAAALGAVSENEKIFGRTLIYVGLAEGLAIYGLIISIIILGSIG